MTHEMQNPETKAAAAALAEASTPDALVAQIRAMRAQVPEYAQIPREERHKMIMVAKNTDPDFVQASINGVSASSAMQEGVARTPEELRADTVDANAWTAAEAEAKALYEGIATANLIRRYRIGKNALVAYSLAQRLTRQKEHADLLPHLEAMKKFNRFGMGKRKRAAAPPAAPAPATAQTAE